MADNVHDAVNAAKDFIEGPATSATKNLEEHGIAKTLLGWFIAIATIMLIVIIAVGFLVRGDVLSIIAKQNDTHAEVLKSKDIEHAKIVSKIIESQDKNTAISREDSREQIKIHREDVSKQWQQLKNIMDANVNQATTLQKATEIMTVNGEVMKKSSETLMDNNKLLKQILDNAKK